jgi:hypothetical protein
MKNNKIIFLSMVAIVLLVATALYISNINDKTYDVATLSSSGIEYRVEYGQ